MSKDALQILVQSAGSDNEQSEETSDYMRIGTVYYSILKQPLMSGDELHIVQKWTREAIVDDFGKKYLAQIPRYSGFCTIPNNINYRRVINGFWNKYEPLKHTPLRSGGKPERILGFLKHIFGEQFDLGIDFITILFKKPTQVLPILSLVSEERKTGKTTFLNLMKEIFGANMTLNTNEDFRSQFNSDWATKLIIGVDETFLEKKEDSERIKNLSTGKSYKAESKGIDKKEIEFFGKFILCSNNEDSFIKIDKDEIRYWVRKIPTLPDTENVDLLSEMIKEIPIFLDFLSTRKITTPRSTRMWFSEQEIWTPALDKLKKGNRTYTENELSNIIKDIFIEFQLNELKYTQRDLKSIARANYIPATDTMINRFIDNLNKVSKNSSYTRYTVNHNGEPEISDVLRGRYYTFTIEDFVPADMNTNVVEYFKFFEKSVFEFDDLDNKMSFVTEFNKLYDTNLNLRDFELLVLNLKIKYQQNDNRTSKDSVDPFIPTENADLPYEI